MRRSEAAHYRGTRIRSFVLFALLVGLAVGCGRGRPTTPAPDAGPVQLEGGNKSPTRTGDKSPDAGPETAEDTLKALAGAWRVVSIQNRPPGYAPSVEKVTVHIEGKTLVLTPRISSLERAEIVLDPTKSPKQFDLQLIDREGKPLIRKSFTASGGKLEEIVRPFERVRGIYRLQGDQLTLALSDRDNFRPSEFKPSVMENTGTWATVGQKSATYVVVVELTRGKAGPEPAPTGPRTDKQVAESVLLPMLKAMKAGDYDAALRETDVPFLGGVTGAQRRITTAEGVRAELKGFVEKKWGEKDEYPTDVAEAERWDPMLFTGPQKGYFESMRAATGPDGLWVSLGTRHPEGGLILAGKRALVKVGPGRPKVVGLFSH